MAGLLAWAVGRGGQGEDGSDPIPIIFSPEQEQYARQLDQKSASLGRSIQDLRLRLPPPDISQRLPHLHAHSLASNAALALQLNSHSATREQAQQREAKLQEENSAYEKAISSCNGKIEERLQEAEQLHNKLKELDVIEGNLRDELENAQAAASSGEVDPSSAEPGRTLYTEAGEDASRSSLSLELESKQKELQSMESMVEALEKKWAEVQEKAMKLPSHEMEATTLAQMMAEEELVQRGGVGTSDAIEDAGEQDPQEGIEVEVEVAGSDQDEVMVLETPLRDSRKGKEVGWSGGAKVATGNHDHLSLDRSKPIFKRAGGHPSDAPPQKRLKRQEPGVEFNSTEDVYRFVASGPSDEQMRRLMPSDAECVEVRRFIHNLLPEVVAKEAVRCSALSHFYTLDLAERGAAAMRSVIDAPVNRDLLIQQRDLHKEEARKAKDGEKKARRHEQMVTQEKSTMEREFLERVRKLEEGKRIAEEGRRIAEERAKALEQVVEQFKRDQQETREAKEAEMRGLTQEVRSWKVQYAALQEELLTAKTSVITWYKEKGCFQKHVTKIAGAWFTTGMRLGVRQAVKKLPGASYFTPDYMNWEGEVMPHFTMADLPDQFEEWEVTGAPTAPV